MRTYRFVRDASGEEWEHYHGPTTLCDCLLTKVFEIPPSIGELWVLISKTPRHARHGWHKATLTENWTVFGQPLPRSAVQELHNYGISKEVEFWCRIDLPVEDR